MPIATPQGTLDFKSVDTITFVGASSNTVIDTTTGSLGVGVDGNGPTSNLHVVGHTRLEGDINMLHTANTASIKLNSNVVTEFPRSKKLIKYPRVVLTANGLNQGYTVSGSDDYSTGLTFYGAFTPPTTLSSPSGAWLAPTSGTTGYSTSTGEYLLSAQLHNGSLTGEYVQIVLPERINPVYFTVQPRPESANNNQGLISCIKEGEIWASNDSGTTWTPVGTIQNFIPTGLYQEYIIDNFNVPGYYDTFALIIHKNNGQTFAGVGEWKIFGTPEYDPEADGVDVVVKSVPNVPNTDFLDVFVDAGNASGFTLSGSDVTGVTDLSTPANTMTVNGNVTYNSANKAFVFPGTTSSYMRATLVDGNGNYPLTLSVWFMMTDYNANSWRSIITVGTNGTGEQASIAYDPNQDQLYFGTYGADIYVPHTPELGKWNHVAATFTGGSTTSSTMNVYINGVNMGGVPNGTQTPSFTNNQFVIGGAMNSNGTTVNNPFKGQIANARFYRRAYTSDEIYQLYAYQKEYFGHGDLSMTLKAGRLGIGTSEPRAALDVRGDVRFSNVPHIYATDDGGYDDANDAYINFDRVESRNGIALVGSNGTFEITEQAGAGVYYVDGSVSFHQSNGTEARNLELIIHLNGVSHHSNNRNYSLTAMKHVTGSTYSDLGVTALVKCNVGDKIRLYARSRSSSINVHTPNNKIVIFKVQST